jgi:hypothetical protein
VSDPRCKKDKETRSGKAGGWNQQTKRTANDVQKNLGLNCTVKFQRGRHKTDELGIQAPLSKHKMKPKKIYPEHEPISKN